MQASIRQPDILGRYGGEEFALLMPDTDADMAMRVAERIRVAVQMNGVEWNGQRLSITLSGGIAAFAVHGITSDELIAAADAALYDAKREGRNRILKAAAGKVAEEKAVMDMHATP
jgi:diguanylate cyclase (GGDEF)-like protein